jgi:hypothetical protein
MHEKRLKDGTLIPTRVWYYTLDYIQDNNEWYWTKYGRISIRDLTKEQFLNLYEQMYQEDLNFIQA